MVKRKILLISVLLCLALYLAESKCIADASALFEQATQYEKQGKYVEAEGVYKQVLAEYPRSDDALEAQEKLVSLYIAWDDKTQAEASFQALITVFWGNKGLPKAVDHVADSYREKKQYVKAREIYQYVVNAWPAVEHAADAQRGIAVTSFLLGDEPNGIAATETLLTKFAGYGKIATVVDHLADDLRELRRYEKARELYQHVVDRWPGGAQAMQSLGGVAQCYMLLEDEPNTQQAIKSLVRDFGNQEQVGDVVHRLGYIYHHQLKKSDRAQALYQWVVENQLGTSYALRAQMGLAKIYIERRDDPNTEKAVARLLSDFSENRGIAKAVDHIADEYREHGRYEKARELYDLVVAKWPEAEHTRDARIGAAKAVIQGYIAAGNDADALAAIETLAIDFNDHPGLLKALFQMGEKYYRRGFVYRSTEGEERSNAAFAMAARVWDKILQAPGSYKKEDAYYFSAGCFRHLGDYLSAAHYYQTFADGWPDSAKAADAQYMVGWCYEKLLDSGEIPREQALAEVVKACERAISEYAGRVEARAAGVLLDKVRSIEADGGIYGGAEK